MCSDKKLYFCGVMGDSGTGVGSETIRVRCDYIIDMERLLEDRTEAIEGNRSKTYGKERTTMLSAESTSTSPTTPTRN